MANGPVTPAQVLADVIAPKPWEVPDAERVWRCDEHCCDYGYSDSGRMTWGCPFCEKVAEEAVNEWERAWRRYRFWDRESNIPRRFRTATLESWKPNPANRTIGEALKRYLETLDAKVDGGDGFTLLGPPGVGKSHLLTAVVADAIAQGFAARYAVWPDVVTEVKNGFNLPRCEDRRDIIALLKGADLLALDELALKGASEFESGLLFELIDERYRERRPTIAASNATRQTLGGLIGERLADRLTECSPALVVTGESQRAKVRSAADCSQFEQPPQTITTRQHKSGKWREETKTYQPPYRDHY